MIRWAETNGSEANLYRKNAWIYRDYVVRAFNEDKPYDQFVREQIAGDSMGVGEATGFLVAGPHVPAATVGREPTAIRQARADRMDEIMQTVGASVMGVTIGCARCHNHKFDPISIKDYYSMTGVFQDVEFGGRFPEFSPDHPRRQRGDALWKEIAKQRSVLREMGGWEEDWGAFREMHFKPITTKAIRIRFKMKNVGLDELEVFGPEDRRENLVHQRRGTKVSGFPEARRRRPKSNRPTHRRRVRHDDLAGAGRKGCQGAAVGTVRFRAAGNDQSSASEQQSRVFLRYGLSRQEAESAADTNTISMCSKTTARGNLGLGRGSSISN